MLAFFILTILATLGSFGYILLGLAPEASQGFVQKIFFFHVPAAFSMYACVFVAALMSVLYLMQRKSIFDQWAVASMKTAFLFGSVVIVSGPIWAKPIWGTYWTWDPRLTTTLIVYLLILAYLFTRRFMIDRQLIERARIISALLALLALLDIPLVHLSVRLWRGIHPSVLRNPEGLPKDYSLGLQFMIVSFLMMAFCYLWLFFSVERAKEQE